MNVRISRLIGESIRALWSRPVWVIIVVLAAILVGAGSAAMMVADSRAIAQRTERLAALGWGLVKVSSASGGALPAEACAVIGRTDGVQRWGTVGPSVEASALGLNAGIGTTPVDSGAVEISWPTSRTNPSSGGLLTPGFVRLSGLGPGVLQVGVNGALTPLESDVIRGPGRYAALDGGVLLVHAMVSEVDYCLIEVPAERAEGLALRLAEAGVRYGVLAVPVVSRKEATPTPQDLADEHHARQVPLLGAAFLGVIGALRLLRSRRDRAVYRLLDFGRADLWAMGLVDFAISLAAPMLSAFATVIIVAEIGGVPTSALGKIDLPLLTSWITGVALSYATLFAAGRNRHQFAPGS